MSEVLMWMERLIALLPQIIGLWDAAKASDPDAELRAQLDLTRAIKDRQAREEIGPA